VPWSRDPWVPPVTEAIVPKSWISSLRIRASWWKYDLHKTYSRLRGSRQGEFINAIAASANYPLNEIDYGGLYPSLRLIPELILCPEEFDLPRFKIENQVHYVGAYTDLQRKDGTEFPWERIDPDKPLIYCSLGSLSHRFKEARTLLGVVIDAVTRRYDVQLVLSIGTHLDIEDFNVGAPNVILVNQAPQIAILERADIMITHGGFNSVKECIMLEVPMIVFPWGKPVNGVRVVYHGLGLMNNVRYVSVAHMQKMIDSILETPSFRMRTKAMRKTFVDTDRANLGVKAVELAISASSTDVLREQRLQ
jgi:UDP:flavonoid glycosyltransferase YjiC (YdhE family)